MTNDLDASAFVELFKESYAKCFGYPLKTFLSESESKLFSNEILERTGLIIGWKSLKNYSRYFLNDPAGKQENPSIATLDTLARYVLNAPPTDEIQRKDKESHYPYWFEHKDRFYKSSRKTIPKKRLFAAAISFAGLALFITLLISLYPFRVSKVERFTDNFHSVQEDSLINRGWFVKSEDAEYWNRRGERPGRVTLFTLRGDNWPDSGETPDIKNLLLRKITSDCFTAEVHLTDFIPRQNWQQAGIILLEDTSFVGRSVRVSLAYNDFYGGYPKSKEILVQAITSLGKGFSKPEEIAHKPIFYIDRDQESLIAENLRNSALRIEKHGKMFRFLFSDGAMENSAFKEVVSQEFDEKPKYIGLFALKGFVNDSDYIPAYFRLFSLTSNPCDK